MYKYTCMIHTLSYGPKCCFIISTDPENQDTLIIRTMMVARVAITGFITTSMCLSQQLDKHAVVHLCP